MNTAIYNIHFSPDVEPEEQARRAFAFERTLDDLRAAHRASASVTPGSELKLEPAVQDVIDRFHRYSPKTAETVAQLIHRLTEIGYTFRLPEVRVASDPRPYLHTVRADGTTAGYLNSKSFSFTNAASLAPASPLLDTSPANPRVSLTRDGAVDYIAQVAQAFAQA